jgi:hypothetical protein
LASPSIIKPDELSAQGPQGRPLVAPPFEDQNEPASKFARNRVLEN